MLTIGLVFGAILGAAVWDLVKQSEWFPWESEKVKALRLERDGYKQRLDDVVASLDAEKDVLALLEAREWDAKRDYQNENWHRAYVSVKEYGPMGWRVNNQWHKTLLGAYRKAVIAYAANEKLKEELSKVE